MDQRSGPSAPDQNKKIMASEFRVVTEESERDDHITTTFLVGTPSLDTAALDLEDPNAPKHISIQTISPDKDAVTQST